ncbi:MAG: TRAP transporter TatT component family protein [Vicinamibacterales bacterium]
MSSCIRVFYLTALVALAASGARAADDADDLYRAREDLASARRAADLWRERLQADPSDFEAAWKRSRALYWLGGHAAAGERERDLEAGIDAATRAAALRPERPEGHFWAAANMGALAESFGLGKGIKYRKPIREALERVLAIDAAFQQGSADRALGRWYFKVPGLFGGDKQKSEQHLRRSLTFNPNSTASLVFLAETLLELGKRADARAALEQCERAPLDPDWGPEDREFKAKARTILATLR